MSQTENPALKEYIENYAKALRSQGKLIKNVRVSHDNEKTWEEVDIVTPDITSEMTEKEIKEKYNFHDLDDMEEFERSKLELDEIGKVWAEILSHIIIDYKTNTFITPEIYKMHYAGDFMENPNIDTPEVYTEKFRIVNKMIVDHIPPQFAFMFGRMKVF